MARMANVGNDQKADLKALDRITYSAHAPVPRGVFLSVLQLAEVEEMAGQGMNIAQIGEALRFEPDYWRQVVALNPNVARVYRAGVSDLRRKITRKLVDLVDAGDGPTTRFMAERIGGPQFAPPRIKVETSTAPSAPPAIDLDASVDSAFAEQRRHLNESIADADYEVIEHDPGQPA